MQKLFLQEMIAQNKFTCSYAFNKLNEGNLNWRLNSKAASTGFIFRHIGETMHLFGNFFNLKTEVQNTTMGQTDKGQFYSLAYSWHLVKEGYRKFEIHVNVMPGSDWMEFVDTPFFGTVSKARLFSHILFHNSRHAGQISLTLARGKACTKREIVSPVSEQDNLN